MIYELRSMIEEVSSVKWQVLSRARRAARSHSLLTSDFTLRTFGGTPTGQRQSPSASPEMAFLRGKPRIPFRVYVVFWCSGILGWRSGFLAQRRGWCEGSGIRPCRLGVRLGGKLGKGLHLAFHPVQYSACSWVQNRPGIRRRARHVNTAMPHPVERMRGCRDHGSPDGKRNPVSPQVQRSDPSTIKREWEV